MRQRLLLSFIAGIALTLGLAAQAFATPSPNGPGQPGAPGTTCGSSNAMQTPGGSDSAQGSPFNANGVAGQHYAGNIGTASAEHSGSPNTAISQYDIACFQVSGH